MMGTAEVELIIKQLWCVVFLLLLIFIKMPNDRSGR
jgi:hypothetical protein